MFRCNIGFYVCILVVHIENDLSLTFTHLLRSQKRTTRKKKGKSKQIKKEGKKQRKKKWKKKKARKEKMKILTKKERKT